MVSLSECEHLLSVGYVVHTIVGFGQSHKWEELLYVRHSGVSNGIAEELQPPYFAWVDEETSCSGVRTTRGWTEKKTMKRWESHVHSRNQTLSWKTTT